MYRIAEALTKQRTRSTDPLASRLNSLRAHGYVILRFSRPSPFNFLIGRLGFATLIYWMKRNKRGSIARHLLTSAKIFGLPAELWTVKRGRITRESVYSPLSFVSTKYRRSVYTREMSHVEALASSKGLSRLIMMENAGRSVAEAVARIFGLTPDMKVGVIAGLGNNGGDGLAAARHLRALGVNVYVFLVGSEEEIKSHEAQLNWKILKNLRLAQLYTLKEHGVQSLKKILRRTDVIVDAILGTGLKGEVRPPVSTIIDILNQSRKPIIAVDVPSGLDSDTGKPCGVAVRATATVTLYMPKRGLIGHNPYVGLLLVGSIGLPCQKVNLYNLP